MKPTVLTVLAAGIVTAAALPLLMSPGAAQAEAPSGTLTLIQLQKENHSTFVDNPPKAKESAGDVFTVAGKTRLPDRSAAGTLSGSFTQTDKSGAQGSVTFRLPDGTIEVLGSLASGDISELAIVGGTGTYVGASGTMSLEGGRNKTVFVFDFGA